MFSLFSFYLLLRNLNNHISAKRNPRRNLTLGCASRFQRFHGDFCFQEISWRFLLYLESFCHSVLHPCVLDVNVTSTLSFALCNGNCLDVVFLDMSFLFQFWKTLPVFFSSPIDPSLDLILSFSQIADFGNNSSPIYDLTFTLVLFPPRFAGVVVLFFSSTD